jgi:hypothetical protein
MTGKDCGGHAGLTGELRALLLTAVDRAEPVLERMRAAAPVASPAATCAVCPVCAVLAALRGERTEYSTRLAEHLAGILAVLRAALAEDATENPPQPKPDAGGRTVQRIPVVRVESRP